MPHEDMSEKQVAQYLHMNALDVAKLASRGRIPCRKVGGRYRFTKGELDHWIETQMHELGADRLADIERGVSRYLGMEVEGEQLICRLIPPGGIAVPLAAKTRDAVIRGLVNLADEADLVYDRDKVIREIRVREELCSTALVPGVALPHPRHPLPSDIAANFVVVGLTSSGIPYGGADGSLTRLFFLICCKDDRTHLHVLARLARILQEKDAIDDLLSVESAEELRRRLLVKEQAAIAQE
jgi:PTS system nitrogen regulatory IIA component